MRVELGEVENTIWDLGQKIGEDLTSTLSLVAVVYYKDEADNGGMLAAYLTTASNSVPDMDEQHGITACIKAGLKATLPTHMIPSAFIYLSDLPRTATGKTDYKALLAYPPPKQGSGMVNGLCLDDNELTPTQSIIASVWRDVLRIEGGLTPSDDFFALGGHSLVLVQLQSGIKDRCGVNLSLGGFLPTPQSAGWRAY